VKLSDLVQSAAPGYIITDGAWGTELQKAGLARGESADLWNLSHPDRVEAVARSYVEAGSRIILTNTFQANATRLAAYGQADRAAAINAAGVAISKRAAGGRARVFGSIGPADSPQAVQAQAVALAAGGAEALVVETMTSVEEARMTAAAAKWAGLPVIVSFVFMPGGGTPEEAADALSAEGVDAIGANCGTGPESFLSICARLRKTCNLPLWMKPSAGLPELSGEAFKYPVTEREFGAIARELAVLGAAFVGGCCGTSPEFIRAI
jgi:methionine synthase I (cobalamin-dependent)